MGACLASDRTVALAHPGTVVAGTNDKGAALASVRSVGVGSVDLQWRWSGLASVPFVGVLSVTVGTGR